MPSAKNTSNFFHKRRNNSNLIRVFIVGSPRAGTTLLQSLITANSHVVSFTETHFFERLFSGRLLLSMLGIASRRARSHWKTFVEDLGHPELEDVLPKYAIFVHQYANAFVHILDLITIQQNKNIWVEKTPEHLKEIDRIEKLIDNPKFVHIIRPGVDNIASLYDASQKYPEIWKEWYGTIDQCIESWVEDTRKSVNCSFKENHRVIMYEDLVSFPENMLSDLCDFMGLPFEESMLSNYVTAASQVSFEWEEWKSSVLGPIKLSKSKFYEVFDEPQRQYILNNIPEDLQPFLRSQRMTRE